MSESSITRKWYSDYYSKNGEHRNSLLTNPGVLFQHLAIEEAIIKSLRNINALTEINTLKVLDVGCGSGNSLAKFIELGFLPKNLYGLDILSERVASAETRYPNVNFLYGNASEVPYPSDFFEITMASTMFIQLTEQALSLKIANEMLRVTKKNSNLLIIDWRYGKPWNKNYLAVSNKRIKQLFSVGSKTKIISQANASLIPPVGRFMSQRIPSAYFLLRAVMPFLCGLKVTLLEKL